MRIGRGSGKWNMMMEEVYKSEISAIECEIEGLQTLLKTTSDIRMKSDIRVRIYSLQAALDKLHENWEAIK